MDSAKPSSRKACAPPPTLSEFVNIRRARSDRGWLIVLQSLFWAECARVWLDAGRRRRYTAPGDLGSLLVVFAAIQPLTVWAFYAPSSYARWRELAHCTLRLLAVALLGGRVFERAILADETAWQRWTAGPAAEWLFGGAMLLATGAAVNLLWTVGLPVRIHYHIPVQAATVAQLLARVGALCASPAAHSPVAFGALGALRRAFDALAAVSVLPEGRALSGLPRPDTGSATTDIARAAQCLAVVSMLEVVLCFVLPTLLVVFLDLVEAREHERRYVLRGGPLPAAARRGWRDWGGVLLAPPGGDRLMWASRRVFVVLAAHGMVWDCCRAWALRATRTPGPDTAGEAT